MNFSNLLYVWFLGSFLQHLPLLAGDTINFVTEGGGKVIEMRAPDGSGDHIKRAYYTLLVAHELFDKEQFSKALIYYQQALDNKMIPDPMRAQILFYMAKILSSNGSDEYAVKADYKRAVRYLDEAIELQHVPPETMLAVYYQRGLLTSIGGFGIERDYQKARCSFHQSLKLVQLDSPSYPLLLFFLGKNYDHGGYGADQNHEMAIKCYGKALATGGLSKQDAAMAHCRLGNIYATGNVKPDYARAFKHFYYARNLEDADGFFDDIVGTINRVLNVCGKEIPINPDECATMYFYLGRIFYRGGEFFEKSFPLAIDSFCRSALPFVDKQLQARSHYYMGKAFYFGDQKIQKNWLYALAHFKQVIVSKDEKRAARAHKYVASMLTRGGNNIKQDHKAALLHWLKVLNLKGKKQDYTTAVAHINLGALYAKSSVGRMQDTTKALVHARFGNVPQAGDAYQAYAQRLITRLHQKMEQQPNCAADFSYLD